MGIKDTSKIQNEHKMALLSTWNNMYVKGVQICVIIYFQCTMQPGLNLKLCSLNTIVTDSITISIN